MYYRNSIVLIYLVFAIAPPSPAINYYCVPSMNMSDTNFPIFSKSYELTINIPENKASYEKKLIFFFLHTLRLNFSRGVIFLSVLSSSVRRHFGEKTIH